MKIIPQFKDIRIDENETGGTFNQFQPFDDGELTPPPLPVDCLPKWLGDYCRAVSASTQTPADASVMMALAVLATACQGKFVVAPFGGADYVESLNIWALVSMPPGSRKTAILSAMRAPLTEWESDQRDKLQTLVYEDEARRVINKKRLADLQVQAAKESSPTDLLQQIAGLQEQLDAKPVLAPKLFVGDITPEALQGELAKHGEKMAVLADEGGIFDVITGLYNDGKANIDALLQAWCGSPVRVSRASREVFLACPLLTFGLMVQPEVVASLARGSKARLRGQGALGRFLYACPPSNIGKRDVRAYVPVGEGVKAVCHYNLKALLDLAPAEVVRLNLSADAREVYFDFAQWVEDRQGVGGDFADFQDWTAKLPGQALRIAGLFHVAEHWTGDTVIGAGQMAGAVELCRALIGHAALIFGQMAGDQAGHGDARYIASHLAGRDTITRRELQRLGRFSKCPVTRLNDALGVLYERGYIGESQPSPSTGGGAFYHINPEVNK